MTHFARLTLPGENQAAQCGFPTQSIWLSGQGILCAASTVRAQLIVILSLPGQ